MGGGERGSQGAMGGAGAFRGCQQEGPGGGPKRGLKRARENPQRGGLGGEAQNARFFDIIGTCAAANEACKTRSNSLFALAKLECSNGL